MTLISCPRLLTGDADLRPGWLRIDGGAIGALGAGEPPQRPDLRLDHGVLAAGLVDLQLNGGYGVDLATADAAGWRAVVTRLPRTGVTAFVPTFTSAPVPDLVAALHRYRTLRPELDALPGAARTLGVHVEGPFLAAARRGAHPAHLLTDPSPHLVAALIDGGRDRALTCLTLAPERDGALAAIGRLTASGVRVAIGHSDADEPTVRAAVDAGARLVTHLFNGMPPMHHRHPGVVGAALTDERLTCGLIADGHHVAPSVIKVAFAAAAGRIALVSDAVAAFGMPPGRYLLGGVPLTLPGAGPPVRDDGALAGAVGRLDAAIGAVHAAGVPLRAAVEAATRVPADALGRPDLGRLFPGAAADLVWLASPDEGTAPLRACATWIAGQRVQAG